MGTRNNLLKKLARKLMGFIPNICHCVSQSTSRHEQHGRSQDAEFHKTCRIITSCLKPTNVIETKMISGIGPPKITLYYLAAKWDDLSRTRFKTPTYGRKI